MERPIHPILIEHLSECFPNVSESTFLKSKEGSLRIMCLSLLRSRPFGSISLLKRVPILWTYIANATPTEDDEDAVTMHQKLEGYSFNPDTLFGLINAEDSRLVIAGIVLFAFARFPITDDQSRQLLKTALTWPQQDYQIEYSWSQFLRNARVVDEDRVEWAEFLQELLNETHKYSDEILDAAKWRYQQLAGDESNTSIETRETALGLP